MIRAAMGYGQAVVDRSFFFLLSRSHLPLRRVQVGAGDAILFSSSFCFEASSGLSSTRRQPSAGEITQVSSFGCGNRRARPPGWSGSARDVVVAHLERDAFQAETPRE